MKNKVLLMMTVFLMGSLTAFSQVKTEKFKVYGNCGMCETRIEKAAKSVDGVSEADWNKETKMVEVKFNSDKTNVNKVHMAIADAGHDTEMQKAKDEDYNKLPQCCKYDRKKE